MGVFESYMVRRGAARDVKLRRLTGPEKAAFLLGMEAELPPEPNPNQLSIEVPDA